MKIKPIDDRLYRAIAHVSGYAKHMAEETEHEYKYGKGLNNSIELVNEYISCFAADGTVSQRGEVPQCWNEDTIFEPHYGVGEISYAEEEASPEQKDANAKKLLEELT